MKLRLLIAVCVTALIAVPVAGQTLTRDQQGRRLNLLVPEDSLFLRKPAGQLPHGGDKRFAVGSPFYTLLRQSVAEGAKPE